MTKAEALPLLRSYLSRDNKIQIISGNYHSFVQCTGSCVGCPFDPITTSMQTCATLLYTICSTITDNTYYPENDGYGPNFPTIVDALYNLCPEFVI